MKVSVIMPVRDRPQIHRCVSSLQAQADEVIVVYCNDNSPAPKGCTVYRLRFGGFPMSVPVNFAAVRSSGDIILVGCAECVWPITSIQRVREEIGDNEWIDIKVVKEGIYNKYWDNKTQFLKHGGGYLFAIKRDYFFKIGGYDERYQHSWGYDDLDIKLRMKRAGGKTAGVLSAAVGHLNHVKVHDVRKVNINKEIYLELVKERDRYLPKNPNKLGRR